MTVGASALLRIRSPFLVLVQIRRIWFAGASLRSLAIKEIQSLFTDDVGDVEQARTMQNFIVRHEIMPADCYNVAHGVYISKIIIVCTGEAGQGHLLAG